MAKKTTTKATISKPAPTRVSQSALAKEQAAEIIATTAKIKLPKPLTVARRHQLVGGCNVSDDFLERTAQAFEALGAASGTTSFDPDAVRTAIAARKSQGPVLSAVDGLVQAVQDRTLNDFGGQGLASLDFYAQLKVKGRNAPSESLIKTHIAALSKAMADHRRLTAANNKAVREANAAKRTERDTIKAATKEAKKATKGPTSPKGKTTGT